MDQNVELVHRLLDKDVLIFVVGGSIAIIAIVTSTLSTIVRSVARERSRREIAAYIAEGSMTPEQGERLMAAGVRKDGGC